MNPSPITSSDIIALIDELLPLPLIYVKVKDRKHPVSLQRYALICKIGKGHEPDADLRKYQQDNEVLVATLEPWISEYRTPMIGARVFKQQTDTPGKLDGGIIDTSVVMGGPTLGTFHNKVDGKLEEAIYVPVWRVAKSPHPIRFSEIIRWNDGQFDKFRSYQGGVVSSGSLEVWNEYTRRFAI